MQHSVRHAPAWIVQQATATPRRLTLTRYVLAIGLAAALLTIISRTPLDGPAGGVIALTAIGVCCWFAGLGPALLMPLTVWFVSRFPFDDPAQPVIPTAPELMSFLGLTMLTGAVGLAGQFRRRLRTEARIHDGRIRDQARALSAARIVFLDVDGRITTWSEGAQQLYGWNSDEAVGSFLHELLHTEFPDPLDEIRAELRRDGQWRGEVVQVRQDGQRLNVAVHCIFYAAEGGGPLGFAEVHNDVTDLRRAEAVIQDSDRRKDLFVATLAHELRNPLAPMRSGLDILRMTRTDPAEDDVLEIMQRQLDHVVRMIDDLLDVSRINTGKVELRRANVLLSEVVRDAVAACRPQIDEARHTLIVTVPDDEVWLHADAARLVQVVVNLLTNAAKFTDAGGEIRLSAVRDGCEVEIRVRDNGVGIPAGSLSHIFDMFSQIDDPHTRSRGGLGLGLNIVRTLVELHGGTVEAHSDGPGRGTEFIVRLLALADHVPAGRDDRRDSSSQNGKPASQRVLVVDDNRDAARMLALMFNNTGFECRTAYDGPSALVAADEFRPQAIVLDLGMPGMSGLEVARRLRANAAHDDALLIAVTGWDKEEDRNQTRDAGFDRHFAKPVAFDELSALVGSHRATPPAAFGGVSTPSRTISSRLRHGPPVPDDAI